MVKGSIFFKNKSCLYDLQSVTNCLYNAISEESPVIMTLESKYEGDLIMNILFRIKDDLKENGITTFIYFPTENYPAKLNFLSL